MNTKRSDPEYHSGAPQVIYPHRDQVFAELLRAHGADAGRDGARLASELLPTLLERSGDANARIAKGVEDAVAVLADVPEVALASQTGVFVR